MNLSPDPIVCDGCGEIASPEHISRRIARLELATRYRPVHIHTLVVAMQPADADGENFFAGESREFQGMLDALDISGPRTAQLLEFQRRGFFLAYLAECPPVPSSGLPSDAEVSRLTKTLARRVRFNYKPKHLVPAGHDAQRMLQWFEDMGLSDLLLRDEDGPLVAPAGSDGAIANRFRKAFGLAPMPHSQARV